MNKSLFRGICTAVVTPFKCGKIDFSALDKLIDFQLLSNVNALCFLGSTGECTTITDDEFKAILDFAVKKINGKVKVLCGVGSPNLSIATEKCKTAYSLGVDGLLAVTPYYSLATSKGIIKYYETLSCASPLPIICYNVPKRTGVNITPDVMENLCDIENVRAIKQASQDIYQTAEIIFRCKDKIDVFCGDDLNILSMLSIGANGVISVASNVIPNTINEIYSHLKSNDLIKAKEVFYKIYSLLRALSLDINPIPIKYATKVLGLTNGSLRPPLSELSGRKKRIIRSELLSLGAIL